MAISLGSFHYQLIIMELSSDRNFQSDSKTNTDTSKSGKSVKSVRRKKSEIGSSTIIASIEREVNELMSEITIRAQKNKLLSIGEYLKLLVKRFPLDVKESSNTLQSKESTTNIPLSKSNSDGEIKFREEIKLIKTNYENEILNLKEEIEKLKNVNRIKEKESNNTLSNISMTNANLTQLNKKLEEANYLLSEEKQNNKNLILQIKSLEEALKALNAEYNTLSFKYGKLQSDCDFLEMSKNNMKKNSHDSKDKFEEIVKLNSEMKQKLLDYETNIRLHNEDVKSLLKKIAIQQKTIEDYEVKNKQVLAELAYKEERLKAIRLMNSKLEQKSQQILKKFEAFKLFEEKTNEMTANSQKMYEMIEDLNKRLMQEREEKEIQRQVNERLSYQISKTNSDFEEVRKQLQAMKSINEDIISKNSELENKFKRSLDYRPTDSKDNSLNKERTKTYFSNAISNLTHVRNIPKLV